MTYHLAVDCRTPAMDFRGRVCHRCARSRLDACPPATKDPAAAHALRALLSTRFGEPIRVLWFQQDERRVAVLCRRTRCRPAPIAPRHTIARETYR